MQLPGFLTAPLSLPYFTAAMMALFFMGISIWVDVQRVQEGKPPSVEVAVLAAIVSYVFLRLSFKSRSAIASTATNRRISLLGWCLICVGISVGSTFLFVHALMNWKLGPIFNIALMMVGACASIMAIGFAIADFVQLLRGNASGRCTVKAESNGSPN